MGFAHLGNYNPNGVAAGLTSGVASGRNPLQGCDSSNRLPQGSACRATLGFASESLWDSGPFGRSRQIRIRSRQGRTHSKTWRRFGDA